jgi:hypothetical protein
MTQYIPNEEQIAAEMPRVQAISTTPGVVEIKVDQAIGFNVRAETPEEVELERRCSAAILAAETHTRLVCIGVEFNEGSFVVSLDTREEAKKTREQNSAAMMRDGYGWAND